MIKSQITLKQLEAFVQVVETGSFRRAAVALGTTQPNISARIAALESTLNTLLLHRDAGSVRLTPQGTDLVAPARAVLHQGEAFLEAAARQDLIQDRMRLGVTELIACTWLHRFLRAFRAVYPGVKVELQVDVSREIDRRLQARQLDLALQTAPFKDDGITALPLDQHGYAWVATPQIAAGIAAPELAQVFAHPILTHARHTQAAEELEAHARAQGLPVDQIVTSSSLVSCVPMAVDGMGVALLPRRIVADHLEAGRLVELACPWHPTALSAFARYHGPRAPRFVLRAAELAQETARTDDHKT